MSTEHASSRSAACRVEVVRKAIKNLHLGVYPPDGRVRVAAPLAVSRRRRAAGRHRQAGLDQAPAGAVRSPAAPVRARDGQRREPLLPRAALPAAGRRGRRRRPRSCCAASRRSMLHVRPGSDRRANASGCCSAGIASSCASSSRRSWRSGRTTLGVAGRRLGHQEDEDQVGHLQHRRPAASGSTSNWPRSRRSASSTSSSTSSFTCSSAQPQRAVHRADGPPPAHLAPPPRRAQRRPAGQGDVGVLTPGEPLGSLLNLREREQRVLRNRLSDRM